MPTVEVIRDAVALRRVEIRSELSTLIRLNSENPPGREEAVARHVGEYMAALGADVEYQMVHAGRPNVVGTFQFGPGPCLLLNAHTDTVPMGIEGERNLAEPVVEDGRLYGRGACDDKGGLMAMLTACAAAVDLSREGHEMRGTLVVAGVMGEESSGDGTRDLVNRGLRVDYAIVGEPTEMRPLLGHKGSYRKRLTFHGRAAHSSDPRLGVNAIYGASMTALEIDALNDRLQASEDPIFGAPVVSANVITGGVAVIIIAERCALDVDRRLLPGESEQTAQAEVDDILAKVMGRYPDLTVEVTDLGMGKNPAVIDADSYLARSLKKSVEACTGCPTTFGGYPAGTDMTFLTAAGIPTAIFGPGSITDAHTAAESVSLAEVEQAAVVYLDLFCTLQQ